MVQLKRFRYDSYFPSKVGTHVEFPFEDLDMLPYCKQNSPQLDPSCAKYDLYAIVHHRGGLGGEYFEAQFIVLSFIYNYYKAVIILDTRKIRWIVVGTSTTTRYSIDLALSNFIGFKLNIALSPLLDSN